MFDELDTIDARTDAIAEEAATLIANGTPREEAINTAINHEDERNDAIDAQRYIPDENGHPVSFDDSTLDYPAAGNASRKQILAIKEDIKDEVSSRIS
ncbi:hypothetical protein BGP78_13185 [Pseudoalteromonas sp. MSK9-3]|uniref:hypothetical protein n=1 Tax=Pseudoalteromonas sp. MSK9-3 TaxID=1897633 RepID=UPI000E6C3CA0|nr:hypothetical protein [Pseudoalteromonas sp. MSK9-3]RJE76356.1 hypothetical protein BGP78_13185 [Pseudoalteromonas sp. MSK9-3]